MHLLSGARRAMLVGVIVALVSTAVPVKSELFPRYPLIEPNVVFWAKIYAQYTTRQAVIHDNADLGIIYEVIAVEPYDAPGAAKVNRTRTTRAIARYRDILKRLAADPGAQDADCRRVAALFGKRGNAAVYKRASDQVRSQLGQKDRFQAGLVRSGAYLDEIRTILKSYQLPLDLAYLPHVESSFNPAAYSKFGAAGIWQFTRSTGQRFMTVDYVMDERRDPIRATHAAAQLLAENFARLGSWPLAITAYNHGAAGMARAKSQHGDYPTIYREYRSRSFGFASRNFYSEFLAARDVAANYRDHFGPLELAKPVPTHTVTLEGYLSILDLCRHFAITPERVQQMNPALRPPVFSGQKFIPRGYRLRLPADVAASGVMLAGVPNALYQADQKPSRFYTVQRGDTAGRIARTHGVRLSDLILANNLGSRAVIHPNQTLRIPLAGETTTVAAVPPAAPPVMVAQAPEPKTAIPSGSSDAAEGEASPPMRVAETGSIPETTVLAAASEPPPDLEPAAVVTAPEPPPALAAAALVPPPSIVPAPPAVTGPTSVVPSAEIVAIDVRFTATDHGGPTAVGVLRVEVEETLGHYAEWAGVRTQEIRRLNGLAYGRTLHLHQKIRIPLNKVSAASFEEQRYEYHKRLQEDFFAVYRVAELTPYQVRAGDNYWSLCQSRFGVPMWLLKHYNMEADLSALRVRQDLVVPVIAETAAGEPGTVVPDEALPEEEEVDGHVSLQRGHLSAPGPPPVKFTFGGQAGVLASGRSSA